MIVYIVVFCIGVATGMLLQQRFTPKFTADILKKIEEARK